MADSWLESVRFFPTDDVLITGYLVNKIQENPLPLDGVVIEADIYGQHAGPWQLFQNPDAVWQTRVDPCGKLIANESVQYVFTRLTKVGKGTGKKSRGGGCWHGSNTGEVIEDGNGNEVVIKKTFKYKSVNLPTDRVWIMNEYSVPWFEEFVMSKIKMINREKRNRKMDDGVRNLEKKSRLDHQLHEEVIQGSYESSQGSNVNVQDRDSTLLDLQEMVKGDDIFLTFPDDMFSE